MQHLRADVTARQRQTQAPLRQGGNAEALVSPPRVPGPKEYGPERGPGGRRTAGFKPKRRLATGCGGNTAECPHRAADVTDCQPPEIAADGGLPSLRRRSRPLVEYSKKSTECHGWQQQRLASEISVTTASTKSSAFIVTDADPVEGSLGVATSTRPSSRIVTAPAATDALQEPRGISARRSVTSLAPSSGDRRVSGSQSR